MGSEPDRQHSAETEKSVLGEESVGPSESGSTPLEDRSETWLGQAYPTITNLATQAHTLCRIHIDRHS